MYLVFDTETTGLADFNAEPEAECQPRLVQLGAQLITEDWIVVQEVNLLVKPDGFEIPDEATKVHGISTKLALAYGFDEFDVLVLFSRLAAKAEVLVAHNIRFDAIVMGRAYAVRQVPVLLPPTKRCTMHEMTSKCGLKGPHGLKYPSLTEAYKHCFGESFSNAHDALADVRACTRIFRWLVEGKESGKPVTTNENKSHIVSIKETFNDDTPMPFGKFRGTPLKKVDAGYLHWLWGKRPIKASPQLEEYIRQNIPALKKEYPNGIWN